MRFVIGFISIVFVTVGLTFAVYSQSTVVGPVVLPPVVFDVADQPECPIRVTLSERPQLVPIFLIADVENISGRLIAAYVMTDSGGRFVHTYASIQSEKPIEPGKSVLQTFGVRKPDKIAVTVDYVVYADGSSWGLDITGQSKVISGYLSGWNLAINRLKTMLAAQDPSDFLRVLHSSGGIRIGGTVNVGRFDTEDRYRLMGYRRVINVLRQTSIRQDEARDFARKLELME